MNKKQFIEELCKKYKNNISHSVLIEENEKIYLFYFENKHIGTWVNKKINYIFDNPKKCF